MKVSTRIRDGVLVVSVHGRVTLPRTDVLGSWMQSEIGDRWSGPVLLDCTHMTYVNSAGLREILLVSKRLAEEGGRLAVSGLADSVRRTFEVVGFDQMLDVHETVDEALEALKSPVAPDA